MRAHVGKAAHRAAVVAREQERLVEQPRQQVARRERVGPRHGVEIAEPLPGAREDALARQRVDAASSV